MNCPHCGKWLPDAINVREIGSKGGKAGRGASKARTSEQARAAARALWAKRKAKPTP
jgi:hypothetical protein